MKAHPYADKFPMLPADELAELATDSGTTPTPEEWVHFNRLFIRAMCRPRPEKLKMPSHVYFIRNEKTRLIKIGYSVNPNARLRALEVGAGSALSLLATTPGGRSEETELHRRLCRSRAHGEWFHPTREVLDAIKEAAR